MCPITRVGWSGWIALRFFPILALWQTLLWSRLLVLAISSVARPEARLPLVRRYALLPCQSETSHKSARLVSACCVRRMLGVLGFGLHGMLGSRSSLGAVTPKPNRKQAKQYQGNGGNKELIAAVMTWGHLRILDAPMGCTSCRSTSTKGFLGCLDQLLHYI